MLTFQKGCKLCAAATNEVISVKESLSYNVKKEDLIEGFERWIIRETSLCSKPCDRFHGPGNCCPTLNGLRGICQYKITSTVRNDIIPEFPHHVTAIFQSDT